MNLYGPHAVPYVMLQAMSYVQDVYTTYPILTYGAHALVVVSHMPFGHAHAVLDNENRGQAMNYFASGASIQIRHL